MIHLPPDNIRHTDHSAKYGSAWFASQIPPPAGFPSYANDTAAHNLAVVAKAHQRILRRGLPRAETSAEHPNATTVCTDCPHARRFARDAASVIVFYGIVDIEEGRILTADHYSRPYADYALQQHEQRIDISYCERSGTIAMKLPLPPPRSPLPRRA